MMDQYVFSLSKISLGERDNASNFSGISSLVAGKTKELAVVFMVFHDGGIYKIDLPAI